MSELPAVSFTGRQVIRLRLRRNRKTRRNEYTFFKSSVYDALDPLATSPTAELWGTKPIKEKANPPASGGVPGQSLLDGKSMRGLVEFMSARTWYSQRVRFRVAPGCLSTSIIAGLLALVIGCGRPAPPRFNQPPVPTPEPRTGYWEVTWVDPNVVYEDSLLTVIFAHRVDSFMVSRPVPGGAANSLGFSVPRRGCAVVVNLKDRRGRLLRPLLAQTWDQGNYKVSLDFSRADSLIFPRGKYVLEADVCGARRTATIERR